MYAKIALGNVRKSIRDFSVFFLTLAFGVCVFYAFASINDQTAVMELTQDERDTVQALMDILSGINVFVVIILGFLVVYANRFLIRRRKREFGIYLTLGMDARHVSLIIVIETLAVGAAALVAGLALGVLLSQVMMYVTAALFEATITGFAFAFSPTACLSTFACFAGIFLVTVVFNVITVTRYRLIDLINADKVSEKVRLRSLPLSVVLFLVSLALIGVAYKTLIDHGFLEEGPYFSIATALVTVGTLLLFFSFSGFALRALQASPRAYLRGLNMFVMRQLNSRVNTAWLSISMVCAMLFLAICGVCSGFSLATGLNESMLSTTRYDLSLITYPASYAISAQSEQEAGENDVYDYDADEYDADYDAIASLRADIADYDELFSDAVQVNFYGLLSTSGEILSGYTLNEFLETTEFEGNATMVQTIAGSGELAIALVKVSDYNALAELAGEETLDLGEDGCALWSDLFGLEDFWLAVCEQNPTLTIQGRELTFVEDCLVDLLAYDSAGSGSITGALIVPDDVVPEGEVSSQTIVNLMYNGEREDVDEAACAAVEAVWTGSYYSAAMLIESNSSTTVAFTYLAIYLGVILLLTCATVLALQQLSEAADNVGRYRTLAKLGAERGMLDRALLVQVGVYFLLPLVVALCHAAVALSVVSDVVELLVGSDIGSSLAGTACFVVALYGGYFLLTYRTSCGFILRSGILARRA